MITNEHKALIRDSWRLVVPIADTAADLFYRRLFELRPGYRSLFPADLSSQKRKLMAMLGFIVRSLDWPDEAWRDEVAEESDLFLVVLALGRRHVDLYKVPDEGYAAVGEALLWTLDYGLGKAFTPPVRDAWGLVYRLVSTAMKMGRFSVDGPSHGDRALAGLLGTAGGESPAGGGAAP